MEFEMKKRDAAGRICRLTTDHGTVTTPTLLPVINPNKMILTPSEMKELFDTEMVITNSYIIRKDEQLRKEALERGVHKLIDFDGPIMTDSGTFQSYVYGDIDVDPLEIIRFQRDIGSDIGTILDIFGTPDQSETQAEQGVVETINRAKDSISHKGEMNIACPVQGGVFPGLRTQCAEELSKLDADVHPIGGVVPLMEDQHYSDLVRVIIAAKKGLPPGRPVHLFGAGHPMVFALAVALGCDLFDSSAYIKYAQQDRVILPWGTVKLNEIEELGCSCPVCVQYSADELKKMSKKKRLKLLAKHNLYVSMAEIKRIRNAIHDGKLWELVEQKARLHPSIIDGCSQLRSFDAKKWLELFEPVHKKRALFYTGDHSIHRPLMYRVHQRLIAHINQDTDTIVLLPERKKPYLKSYAAELNLLLKQSENRGIYVDSMIGPMPIWLDEMYPFAQSLFPCQIDQETQRYVAEMFADVLDEKKIIPWDEIKQIIKGTTDDESIFEKNIDGKRIDHVGGMQFGTMVSQALFQGELVCNKSKKTGKIRTVFCDGKHIVSMRASDGMFTLKKEGAKKIHKMVFSPCMRVVISNDAVPFVADGKSVFAKFVVDCDPSLRPYDECLIVDKDDKLIAVGRCLLNNVEMMSFSHGIAVKNRESCTS